MQNTAAPQTGIAQTLTVDPSKVDTNGGIVINAESDYSLFEPLQPERLKGIHMANIVKIEVKNAPPRKTARAKKPASKPTKAAKTQKPVARNVHVTFELVNKRADGTAYSVEKAILANRAQDSRLGEFVKMILPETKDREAFFNDWRLARLVGKQCRLQVSQSEQDAGFVLKIVHVFPLVEETDPPAAGEDAPLDRAA
jgi:hypothetical protein